jgi:hypothetical protein
MIYIPNSANTYDQIEVFVVHPGPRKTTMPCSARSRAISAGKKVPHETADYRVTSSRSLRR